MSRARTRALAVVGAVGAAVVGWTVLGPLGGVDLTVHGGNGRTVTVGAGPVVVISLAAGLAGWALLALLELISRHARGIWTGIAAVVLLLSLAPLTGGTSATSTRLALGALHVLVAAVLVPVMWQTARRA